MNNGTLDLHYVAVVKHTVTHWRLGSENPYDCHNFTVTFANGGKFELHLFTDNLSLHVIEGESTQYPKTTDYDPTPWCTACGARRRENCKCGPIASNE